MLILVIPGPPGETGVIGETGPMGPRGMRGAPGEIGLKGEKGESGPRGRKGDQGVKGSEGLKGDQGKTGVTGERGPTGDPGADGKDFIGNNTDCLTLYWMRTVVVIIRFMSLSNNHYKFFRFLYFVTRLEDLFEFDNINILFVLLIKHFFG